MFINKTHFPVNMMDSRIEMKTFENENI